jgi:hypothetical protein
LSSEPRKPLAEEHFEPIVEDGATNLEEEVAPSADQRIGWRFPILSFTK